MTLLNLCSRGVRQSDVLIQSETSKQEKDGRRSENGKPKLQRSIRFQSS